MNFLEISSFIAPLGLIIAGIIMKTSSNKEKFSYVQKYWFIYILTGFVLLINRLYKLLQF
jgi:hypothetical protein